MSVGWQVGRGVVTVVVLRTGRLGQTPAGRPSGPPASKAGECSFSETPSDAPPALAADLPFPQLEERRRGLIRL